MTNTITSVTPILVFAITGYMSGAVTLITIGFAITGATAAAAATASTSAATTVCCTAYGAVITAVPGKMS
jgi:hypothetical protein